MAPQSPTVHSVHFYEKDEGLIQRLGSIVLAGLDEGVCALLVMTDQHRQKFHHYLKKRGIDPHRASYVGDISVFTVEDVLPRLYADGRLDRDAFRSVIGRLVIAGCQGASRAGLTVFGELVAALYTRGDECGALDLEGWWNELLQEHNFHLHCAYPRALFADSPEKMRAVCECHSIAVGAAA